MTGDRFDPASVTAFQITEHRVEHADATLRIELDYLLVGDRTHRFTEIIMLDGVPMPSPARWEALRRLVRLLHLAAGTSYWKTAAPPALVVPDGLTPAERHYGQQLYLHGLGEYGHVNGIDIAQRLHWHAPERAPEPPVTGLALTGGPLVPVGGGKDSCVSIELVRDLAPVLFEVGRHTSIEDVLAAADLPAVRATRRLDPHLFELNDAGALNGHVPVTAVVSLIALLAAVAHGRPTVVMSNERSASVGNLTEHGREVNHQWSKGLDAERLLAALVTSQVSPELGYHSLLRPLSELHIARLFAHAERFHPMFTSCNRAFQIRGEGVRPRWCTDCPKCRFVYLALAPWLDRECLVAVFGRDMLADAGQEHGFLALLGIGAYKPFECVGEIVESRAAVTLLGADWDASVLVPRLRGAVDAAGRPTPAQVDEVFTPRLDAVEHTLPAALLDRLVAGLR